MSENGCWATGAFNSMIHRLLNVPIMKKVDFDKEKEHIYQTANLKGIRGRDNTTSIQKIHS